MIIKVAYTRLNFALGSSCGDSQNFITSREYTFWLECECESLSRQLIQFEYDLFPSAC